MTSLGVNGVSEIPAARAAHSQYDKLVTASAISGRNVCLLQRI